MDLRGQGNTLAQGTDYSPSVLAADFKNLLTHKMIDNYSIYTKGEGRKIAMQLAKDDPNSAKSIFTAPPEELIARPELETRIDPRKLLEGLEEIPQIYNSMEEARIALIKKFGPKNGEKIFSTRLVSRPAGDFSINKQIPVAEFIDYGLHVTSLEQMKIGVAAPVHQLKKGILKRNPAAQIDNIRTRQGGR